jgi:thioredoxin 1
MALIDTLKQSGSLRNVLVVGVAVLFIAAAMFVYRSYFQNKQNYVENSEFNQGGDAADSVDVVMFYTDWCPHCKKAKPIWNKVKEELDNTILKGNRLTFKEYDRDKHPDLAEKYEVEGVPTIFLLHGEKMVLYDANVKYETLIEFINTSV